MRALSTAIILAISALVLSLFGTVPAQAAGGIIIYRAYYDSPGSDSGSNSSLNAEYIQLRNTSGSAKYITGWTLRDAANHVYKFPSTKINAGNSLYVRTGKGTNDWNDRYWGKAWYVWNNTGDTATLRTGGGTLVDKCSWSTKGSGYKYC